MSDYFEDMDEMQRSIDDGETRAKYRLLFRQGIGRDVLTDILSLCHFGSTLDPDNKVQIAEYNVGIAILGRCGMLGDAVTLGDVARALCNVTPNIKEEAGK
jgi:hypothetical protein